MAAIKYEYGTVENMVITPDDLSNQITSFTGTNPRVSIRRPNNTYVYVDRAASTFIDPEDNKSKLLPLLDTVEIGVGDGWRLYVRLDTPPETPYLGPIEFDIVDA